MRGVSTSDHIDGQPNSQTNRRSNGQSNGASKDVSKGPLAGDVAGPVGRVVATERRPNTPHEFHFWTAAGCVRRHSAPSAVRVVGTHPVAGQLPTVYGVVVEGFSYTDLQSPLHDVLGHDGSPARGAYVGTDRTEIRLYTAAVLRQVPEEPLQPVPMGEVFLADDADVACALRMDAYLAGGTNTGIPIGVYHAGGTDAAIYADADFLLGPEAAHVTVTGVSGLATKTSAVEWLLASIFTHFPASKGSVAAVCFNVKGPDLCFLDQPATSLSDADLALYDKLGVPPKPFPNVHYYAPYTANGVALNTLRTHEALAHNTHPLVWGLQDVMEFADVLLTREDIDAKADALIDFIRESVVGHRFVDDRLPRAYEVQSFSELNAWFADVLRMMEQANSESWRTHHIATIRKIRNRLTNIAQRCAGLDDERRRVAGPAVGRVCRPHRLRDRRRESRRGCAGPHLRARRLDPAQETRAARSRCRSRDRVRGRVEQVPRPGDGLTRMCGRCCSMWRSEAEYLGLVLFGAQQFRSQVHRRVIGNAGTQLFGRMDGDELATPGYAVLSPAVKIKLATLEKGQLMVRHPHFTQPVFVRFPRPAVLSGREGADRFPRSAEPPLEVAVTRSLRQLDPSVTLEWVKQITGLYEPHEILRAKAQTELARPGDDVKKLLQGAIPGSSRRRVRWRGRLSPRRSIPRRRTTRTGEWPG